MDRRTFGVSRSDAHTQAPRPGRWLLWMWALAVAVVVMPGVCQQALADDDGSEPATDQADGAGDQSDASAQGESEAEDVAAEDDADAGAQDPSAPPEPTVTGQVYPLSAFVVNFHRPIEGLDSSELLNAKARFSVVDDVYTAVQPGAQVVEVSLKQFDDGRVRQFDATGLRTVVDALLTYMNREAGLIGVVVTPDQRDIDLKDLSDKREEGQTEMRMVVYTARVGRLRTLASGDRVEVDERENNAIHAAIREDSPLNPGEEDGGGDVISRTALDEYLYRLNRHPGRRVDAAISAGQTTGDVTLDYLVSESKPWFAYFQLSNTGTDSTHILRERFGFVHNQLTNSDDIFSISFLTGNFEDTNALSLSYERPFTDRLSARVAASYSEYDATDVGVITQNFGGDDLSIGGDLIYNIAQFDDLFIDAVGGVKYFQTETENTTLASQGEDTFWLGHVGLEAERESDIAQARAYADVLWTFNQGERSELVNMGRTNPDTTFAILTAGLTYSFFLEPVLNYAAWADVNDPDTSTLAHELVLGVRAQSALDSRLIPTFSTTAGGAYTVRGYDESVVSGDNSVIGSAEYRFHVPRAMGIRNPDETLLFGEPFRVTPSTVYGQADWDFILKAFLDAAYVSNNDKLAFENDETLVGSGLGFEVSYKNNIRFRGEWGFVLHDAGPQEKGDNRFHFFLTLLY